MAVYQGEQSLLDAALGSCRPCGFSLHNVGNHVLALRFRGIDVDSFDLLTVTISEIRERCHVIRAFMESLVDF